MMKRFYDLPISFKFRLVLTVTVICIVLIMAGAFIVMAVKSHQKALSDRIEVQAKIIAAQASRSAIYFNDPNDTEEILGTLEKDKTIQKAIISLEGIPEYASYPKKGSDTKALEKNSLFMGLIPRLKHYKHTFEYGQHSYEENKTGTIEIHVDLSDFYTRLKLIFIPGLFIALFCAIIAILVVGRVIKRMTQPILQLADKAKEVAVKQDYNIRATVVDRDEIGTLTENLNEMMGQIQSRDDNLAEEVRKQTAEMKKAMDEAKAANAAKSEFIANISHEIRTPMNAIVNMNDFALETELTPKQRDYLTVIGISASLLLSIINDILDMSKIEAGQLALEQVEFNPVTLLNELAYLQTSKAEQNDVEFILDYPLRLEHYLFGDGLRLGQVLLNLVSNAIKFTKAGEIIIAINLLEETSQQVKLLFSVSDTGLGISEAYQKNLFDCFSQADVSTTREYGGTGLGLYISQKLINLMGGLIQVESELGRGSRFFFTLTFNKSKKTLLNRLTDYRHHLENLKVLLLNENLSFQRVLESWFHDLGGTMKSARDLQAAISELETQSSVKPYDLFLIDWRAVKMNEFFSQQIFEDFDKLVTIPSVVMATSKEHEMMIAKNYYSQSKHVVYKPLKAESLIDAISLAVNGKNCLKTESPDTAKKATIEESIGETHVLLVEDNDINQQVASELLERQGIEYVIANNGKEALEILARQTFDLVLMDIQMPEMDGYQASLAIRKTPKTRELPIVAMTAHAMKEDIERCLASGMNDHVSKPINQDALHNVLIKYLGINRPLKPEISSQTKVTFPKMEGIDFDGGFRRMSHNRKKYADVLKIFVDSHGDDVALIRQALAEKDFKTAEMKAHTLKGAGANIGAVALSATAGKVETQIREHEFETLETLLVELDGFIKDFIAAIRQIMDEKTLEKAAESIEVFAQDVDWKPKLERLRQLVEIHDFSVNIEIETLMEQSGDKSAIYPQLKQIEEELKQFRFEKVSELIASLIARLERAG